MLVGVVAGDLRAEPGHLVLDGRLVEQHLAEAVDGGAASGEPGGLEELARLLDEARGRRARRPPRSSKHCEMVRTECSAYPRGGEQLAPALLAVDEDDEVLHDEARRLERRDRLELARRRP